MARVHIDPVRAKNHANAYTLPMVKRVISETVALSKRWPRAGNPAWTDSNGALNRATTGQTYKSPSPHGYVRNDKVYALAVHQGTEFRLIFSQKPSGMNFYWKRFGRRGRGFRVVKHPATKGSFFLTRPLAIVSKRNNFKTQIRIVP